jgi:FKBP-type peptidyl-prolyl cis-trans isomerase SlyD
MQISNSKVVTITYELTVTDSDGEKELVEIVEQDEPMAFIYGMSGLPEAFEDKLEGLVVNDSFDFSLPADDGYGQYDTEAVVELPINLFKDEKGNEIEGLLEEGNIIPMTDDKGSHLNGKILAINPETITVDFNHPLAGKEMSFKGSIMDVREATESEIEHGHVHGHGGVEH